MPDGTLIGRESEVKALQGHLDGDTPVVLLTGPAGVGKSSVAEEVAETWTKGPLFICDLANATSEAATLAALGDALSVADTHEAISALLAQKPGTLLVLDGADNALEGLSAHLHQWHEQAPDARILITTRRRIPLDGALHMELSQMSESEAMALFESRAKRARPGFQVPGAKAPVLREVIDRLDRMPEAIGLAADRMQVLSLDALDRRLAQPRIAVGAGSDPRGPMRKAFDSAWTQLDTSARLTLQRCAVFAGPFDASAAEAIVDLPAEGPSVPTALAELENHSLIQTRAEDGDLRFWMLDAIRQFADQALELAGERANIEARFVTWHAALAGRVLGQQEDRMEALQELNAQWDNLMAAASLSLETRAREAATLLAAIAPLVGFWRPIDAFLELGQDADLDAGGELELQGRLALALARAAWRRGRAHDASRALDEALRTNGLAPELEAELFLERALLAHRQGVAEQRDSDLADALSGAEKSSGTIRAQVSLALAQRDLSAGALKSAREHATDAAVYFEDGGDPYGAALAAVQLGQIILAQGEIEDAKAQLELAIAYFERVGDKRSQASAQLELGRLSLAKGDEGIVAKGQMGAALERALDLGDLELAGRCHASLALYALEQGDEQVTSEHIEGAAYAHRRTSREGAAIALGAMGLLESQRGRLGMAERRLGDATRTLEALGAARSLALYRAYLAWVLIKRGDKDQARATLDMIKEGADDDANAVVAFTRALLEGEALPREGGGLHARLIAELDRAHRAEDDARAEGQTLHVEREGRWFQVGGGALAELGHRKPMRRILLGLAEARESSPGEGMTTEAIFEAGWPGERATPDSARNRVYVTIRRLRSSGLEDVLLSHDGGYYISPEVKIKWSPGRT